jgi:hypothetical protein
MEEERMRVFIRVKLRVNFLFLIYSKIYGQEGYAYGR